MSIWCSNKVASEERRQTPCPFHSIVCFAAVDGPRLALGVEHVTLARAAMCQTMEKTKSGAHFERGTYQQRTCPLPCETNVNDWLQNSRMFGSPSALRFGVWRKFKLLWGKKLVGTFFYFW
jgi:hypothetical protein